TISATTPGSKITSAASPTVTFPVWPACAVRKAHRNVPAGNIPNVATNLQPEFRSDRVAEALARYDRGHGQRRHRGLHHEHGRVGAGAGAGERRNSGSGLDQVRLDRGR